MPTRKKPAKKSSPSTSSLLKILRIRAVMEQVGLPRSTIYLYMTQYLFPKPIHINGGRSVGWMLSDIEKWIQKQRQGEA